MIYCSNCGKPVPDENKFCSFCGTPRPASTTPIPSSQQPVAVNPTGTKNSFLNNAGFWGALLLLIGFFLPFYKTIMDTNLTDITLAEMATGGDNAAGRILLILLPISAIIMLIQSFTYAFHPVIANIARILPLLLMVFALGAIMREDETGRSLGSFFEIAQIGVYVTLLGALLMLFFRGKKN